MSTKISPREYLAEVTRFNDAHPIGSPVNVKLDSGAVKRTTVRFPATVSSSGHAVVWLNGISGYYLTDRVTAAKEVES